MSGAARRLGWVLGLVAGASTGALGEPAIQHFVPHALMPGSTVTLTFSGSGLKEVTGLWTSFGGSTRPVTNDNPELISFEVECPQGASGIGALQLYGMDGASDYELIAVDELAVQPHADRHQTRDSAHRLSLPAAVDCILKKERENYYVIRGGAGEVVSVEVIANRVGSEMDSVVKVLDSAGKEVAFCDDEPGTSRDSRFQFTCPMDGDYFIVVHDVGFGGGPAFDYRLRVGSFPVRLEARLMEGSSAAVEMEPNDSPETSQQIGFPAHIQGRIGPDADHFKFLALKDQKLVFRSATRSINSPADLLLRVSKEDGSMVAESDGAAPSDAALTNTFNEAGLYTLQARELSGSADGKDLPYQIDVAPFSAGFTLETETDNLTLKPGGSAILKVKAVRYDFSGPITLEVRPTTEELTFDNHIIPEGKNETELKITAAALWQPGAIHHIHVEGRSEKNEVTAAMSTSPALAKRFPLLRLPPSRIDGLISVGIKKPE